MERDLDEEVGQNQQNNFGMGGTQQQQNEPAITNKDFQTNESLGMDGIEVVLEDYNHNADAQNDQGQSQGGGNGAGEESKERQQAQNQLTKPSTMQTWCPALTLSPLVPYFQVSSKTVRSRIGGSLIPFNRKFQPQYAESPDLYGPFWILSTLVLVLFVAGNIERYSRHAEEQAEAEVEEDFEYNYSLIPTAMAVLYGAGLGLPLLVKCLVNTYGQSEHPTPLVNAVGIYGYSFSSFIITCLLCAIPIDWLQWLLISYSAITSLSFLISTYWQDFKTSLEPKYRWGIIFIMCAVQLTLLVLFKLYFFKHV